MTGDQLFLAAVCIAPFWVTFLFFMMSRLNGWNTLAKLYPGDKEPEGKRFSFTYLRLGIWRYKNAIHITVAEEGVYMRAFILFALSHKPIFLPWSAFESALGPTSIQFLATGYIFKVRAKDKLIEMRLFKPVGAKVVEVGKLPCSKA